MSFASIEGSASCTRCTSSQPALDLVSTSPSAASWRCSPLRRAISSASVTKVFLSEDAVGRECRVLVGTQTEQPLEDGLVVLAERRPGTIRSRRRLGQRERRRHEPDLAQSRMRRTPPDAAVCQLRIVEELANRLDRRGAQATTAERSDDLLARSCARPLGDARIELGLALPPAVSARE